MPDTFAFFYVYRDSESPWIVRNPPANFTALVAEWKRLDDLYTDDKPAPGYDFVNVWLKAKGVDILEAAADIYLDDC